MRKQAPPAFFASYMARSARASRLGRSPEPVDSAMPTLTVNMTGVPSLLLTRGQRSGQPGRDLGGPVAGGLRDHDDELITAVPADNIVRPHLLAAGLRHVSQDAVADGMAVYVVDLLEVVHVDQQDGERLAEPLRMGQSALPRLHEMAPVVQTGHPVD